MKTKICTTVLIQILIIINIVCLSTISQEENIEEAQWPTSWIKFDTDPGENGDSDDYRDVWNAYYNVDNNYLYFRLECYGFPNFSLEPEARYKWYIDIDNPYNMGQSGGNVFEAEYLLIIEDSPKPGGDGIGDIYLLHDENNDGFIDDDWSNYLVTPGSITDTWITNYRIQNNSIDAYIQLEYISSPKNSYFTWATDQEDPNLDSAPKIDRSNSYWDTDLTKADISIVKSDSIDPIFPGETFTYTLLVTNHGPHISSNVTISDVLPSNIILNTLDPAPSVESYPSFFWNIPMLDVGETYQITLNVSIDNETTGVIFNTAMALNETRDPIPGNNIDREETKIESVADLSIEKVGNNDCVYPGDIFTYTIHLTNHGPHNAENVTITDNLPDALTFSYATPAPSTNIGSNYSWAIPLIESGESVDIIVTVVVDSVPSEVISNTVYVTSDTTDLFPENDMVSEETTIGSAVDLSIIKSDNTEPVYPGSIVTYMLEVKNNGPDTSINVNVSDKLPEGVHFENATPIPTGNNGLLYWWHFPSLASGETLDIDIHVSINTTDVGIILNTAQITSDTYELVLENNFATQDTMILKAADLNITKVERENSIDLDRNLTYTITVTNHGPHDAVNVSITDIIPSNFTFITSDPLPSGNKTGIYWWNISLLMVNESVEIIVNVTVHNGTIGPISNSVYVTSDIDDPFLDNNENTVETVVKGIADLSIQKSSNVYGKIYPGDHICYTINITNHGPDPSSNITVTDILPSAVNFVNATPLPNGSNNSTYWWKIPSLPAGDSIIIIINVTVKNGASGTITNIAFVNEEAHDPEDENDWDDEETTIYKKSSGGRTGGVSQNQNPTAHAAGPYVGLPGEEILLNGTQSHDNDENGDSIVRFDWKFFDEDEWHNNTNVTMTYIYNNPGIYTVTLRVYDDEYSSNCTTTTVTIIQPNRPPSSPQINGPTNGNQYTTYFYSVFSSDQDNDFLQYRFDWDDNFITTTGLTPSGIESEASHFWYEPGIYTITVEAVDNQTISKSTELTVLIDVHYVKDIGYLIDNDSDGTYDSFYSNQTHNLTYTKRQSDGKYLINSHDDEDWDWIYDPELDILIPYTIDETQQRNILWPWLIVLILIIIITAIHYYQNRRTRKKENIDPSNI